MIDNICILKIDDNLEMKCFLSKYSFDITPNYVYDASPKKHLLNKAYSTRLAIELNENCTDSILEAKKFNFTSKYGVLDFDIKNIIAIMFPNDNCSTLIVEIIKIEAA